MAICIFSDTTGDVPKSLVESTKDLKILPLAFSLDNDDYDNVETTLPIEEFYARVKAGAVTKTSMPTQYIVEKMFTEELEKGNDILCASVSSGISGTFDGAFSVAKSLKEKYPERNIEVIDTKLASGGQWLLVEYLLQKREEGVTFAQLLDYAKYLCEHISSYFTCTDLKHLARMGRLSNAAAIIGTILKIMPVMYVDPNGKLKAISKEITRKKALKRLLTKFEEKMSYNDNKGIVTITNAGCIEDALLVKNEIESKYGLEVKVSDIGPVIGSHTSVGCVALFFLTEDRTDADDTSAK